MAPVGKLLGVLIVLVIIGAVAYVELGGSQAPTPGTQTSTSGAPTTIQSTTVPTTSVSQGRSVSCFGNANLFLCENATLSSTNILSVVIGLNVSSSTYKYYNIALACVNNSNSAATLKAMVYIYANGTPSRISPASGVPGYVSLTAKGQTIHISGISCQQPLYNKLSLDFNWTEQNGPPSSANPLSGPGVLGTLNT